MTDLQTERPVDSAAQLMTAVRDLTPLLREAAPRSEEAGTLAPEVVTALRDAGLFRMRLMRELGGLELSINSQIDILAAIAEVDTASAWCTMVANNGVASIGAYMPDETIEVVFASGVPVCAGVAAPAGRAVPVEGGYRVSGTWRFASGVRQAEWVFASTFINADPSAPLFLALRDTDIEILDSWHVLGLRGTGSCDFSVDDAFVPAALTLASAHRRQLRGTRVYARSGAILAVYEHLAVAVGLARRALGELGKVLAQRGGPGSTADRETVQSELSRLTIKLDAVVDSARVYYDDLERLPATDDRIDPVVGAKGRALASWATEIATECADLAFKRAGGRALYCPNPFEQMKRDVAAAQAHVLVNDSSYAAHGTALIEAVARDLSQTA